MPSINDKMVHEVFPLAEWIERYPLERLRQEARAFALELQKQRRRPYRSKRAAEKHIAGFMPGGTWIDSPQSIAQVEQIRAEALHGASASFTVPADVFVFARGEPARRDVTKVGGLPYWPARRPWPTSAKGTPLTFIAQFCFADSRRLAGRVPGDVLLIFSDGVYLEDWWDDDTNGLHFAWLARGERKLIAPNALPEPRWSLLPCFGLLHQTFDYPELEFLEDGPFDVYASSWQLAVLEGTKIGGAPQWVQGPQALPGRYLCSLGSVIPHYDSSNASANDSTPVTFDDHSLLWGDRGSLYLSLDADENIHWAIQCG